MPAERFLLTAVSLQREGRPLHDIEAILISRAREEGPGCHSRRNFAGQLEILFSDGQCLSCDGRGWALRQQEQVAPLYEAAFAPFAATAREEAPAGPGAASFGPGQHHS
jgi:hypothetical protein